jgi:hypothetical protein
VYMCVYEVAREESTIQLLELKETI